MRQACQDLAQRLATQHHIHQFGTQPKRSSDGWTADHSGGCACRLVDVSQSRSAIMLSLRSPRSTKAKRPRLSSRSPFSSSVPDMPQCGYACFFSVRADAASRWRFLAWQLFFAGCAFA